MHRERLPSERKAITHKFILKNADISYTPTGQKDDDGRNLYVQDTSDLEGYFTVGMYKDGRPGEMFLTVGKAGGVYRAFDAVMIAISIGLQYGVPLDEFISKFQHMSFEPSGFTNTEGIEMTKSVVDYIARWLKLKFAKQQ